MNRLNLIKYKITNFLIKIICQGSTGIFSVGNDARNNYLKYHNSVFNLPYSINIHKFNKKKAFFKNDKVNFLFVGQLIKRKGIDLILKSFSMLSFKEKKKINLTIIGDGPYKEKIKKLTKKNKYLSYQNFLNRQKLVPIYGKNDVFIFPSTFDGWGVAPLEAMASSMSLILSKNVGMNEILKMRDGNEFVKCSPYQLLHSIKKLIKNRKKIVINGKKK